jgi:predicted nucleotidyltransferase
LGNDNFDAIIRDCSKSPNFDLKVEFTQAIDGHDENLRMEYLIEHGYVSPIGPLSFTGTKKTGHKISVEFEPVLHDDSLENNFTLIKNRAELKSKPKNYGKNYVLVIVIDDYIAPRFDNQNDLEALNEFILTNIISLPLDFARLYILGLSGETLLTYEIVEKDRIFRCHYPPETYENRNMKINERLRQKREEVLKLASQHGAFQVRVFGSVARGEDTAASDLDLLVEMEPERSLLDLVAIKQDLEDLLGCKVH